MERLGKTQEILQKANAQSQEDAPCLPCAAKKRAVWKISIPSHYFTNSETAVNNFKIVGDILIQYAKFSEPQVQSIFVSISLLDSDEHLIYTGDEQTANDIFKALSSQGIYPKIEAALKKF